jgi:hypothetical protein
LDTDILQSVPLCKVQHLRNKSINDTSQFKDEGSIQNSQNRMITMLQRKQAQGHKQLEETFSSMQGLQRN